MSGSQHAKPPTWQGRGFRKEGPTRKGRAPLIPRTLRERRSFALASPRGPMQQFNFGFAGTTQVVPGSRHIRATRRAADWRRQLARAFVYMSEQHPEQAEERFDRGLNRSDSCWPERLISEQMTPDLVRH